MTRPSNFIPQLSASLDQMARHPLFIRLMALALVAYVSYRFAIQPSDTALVVFIALLGMIWLRSHLEQGLVLFLVASLFVPLSIGTGTETTIPASMILLSGMAALLVLNFARRKESARHALPLNILAPSLALIFSALLSFLGAAQPYNYFANLASASAQLGGVSIIIVSVIVLLVSASVIKDMKWLRWLMVIAVGACMAYSAERLAQFLEIFWPSILATHADGATLWIWAMALPAGQALYNKDLSFRQRLALFGLALFPSFVAIFGGYRDWASGWVPPLVALGALFMLKSRRLAVLLVAAAIIFVLPQVFNATSTILGINFRPGFGTADLVNLASADSSFSVSGAVLSDAYSVYTREAAAEVLLTKIFPLSPIIGIGPSNYYHYAPLYPILGFAIKFNSHNNYVDILLQYGALGMALVVWFFTALFRHGQALMQQKRSGFESGYILACLAAVPGLAFAGFLGDWVFPFVYNIGIQGLRASLLSFVFLGGMIAIDGARNSAQKMI